MSNETGDAQAIVDITLQAAEPNVLDPATRYAIATTDGQVVIIEPQDEKHLDAPRRVKGSATVLEPDSLRVLWEKYSIAGASELYADPTAFQLTAVLNADSGADGAAFRDHRVVLQCRTTPAWNAWMALDGKIGDQLVFAEHLEDRSLELFEPSATDMLELAQTFEAKVKVDFESAVNLGSGQRGLQFKETITSKAGERGQIEIPAVFVIAVVVFEGGPAYKINARLRYRIADGKLRIGYVLERPEDTKRLAFEEVAQAASEACGVAPLIGAPFGARGA